MLAAGAVPLAALAGGGNPPDPPEDGDYRLSLPSQGRPDAPYPALDDYTPDLQAHGQGPSYTVPVSRHHIIPLNVLRGFYNNVVERGDLLYIRGFLSSLGSNIRLYASAASMVCSVAAVRFDLMSASYVSTFMAQGRVRPGGSDVPHGFDTFAAFYAWLPGNLFVGPRNRSDDPGENLDAGAQFIIGAERFAILRRLYDNMVDYNAGIGDPLNAIIADLTQVVRWQRVTPLSAQEWERVSDNPPKTPRYRIRRDRIDGSVAALDGGPLDASTPDGDCLGVPPALGTDPMIAILPLLFDPPPPQ
ncbi:hypothetical protein L2U69_14960 [Zavarzinia compransoris]|uniref:hypothetical protein n=1 Tax=Zavarzinia marina TaxID=2911065 RepID=UPI001F25ECD7|nr:hypothetical protein [Zavarzinia marina]MCF4166951.1 hypothetical protein [Zavarzinia marina]